jgi:nucleoside-diphosphate-sugar epimerase
VERLFKEGLHVVCLVRPTSDRTWIRDLPVEIRAEGLENADGMAKVFAGVDFVFHVAGLTRGRTAEEYMAANVETTRKVVEAATRCGPAIRRFVYVSSLAAVGPNPSESPLDETSSPQPLDHYGRSKLAGEQIVMAARDGIPVTIVRPPGVYGPRDTNFLPLFRTARRLGIVPALGGRSRQFSLVHAADLAEGIWLAASSPAGAGQTYFIASGTCTMVELAAAMASAMGRRLRLVRVPRPLAILAGEIGQIKWALTGRPQIVSRRKVRDLLRERWTCSWAKARRELGYEPAFGLVEGLIQTADWYVRQGWLRSSKS